MGHIKRDGEPVEVENPDELNTIIINEVQLILAEKRTSLSTLRTGIAVFCPAVVRLEHPHRNFKVL